MYKHLPETSQSYLARIRLRRKSSPRYSGEAADYGEWGIINVLHGVDAFCRATRQRDERTGSAWLHTALLCVRSTGVVHNQAAKSSTREFVVFACR